MILNIYDLMTLGTTTSTLCDGEVKVSSDDIATTLTTTITSATTNGGPIVEVHAAAARDYVSSMSVEEIDDLLLEIDEREASIEQVDSSLVKVKKLGSINENNK